MNRILLVPLAVLAASCTADPPAEASAEAHSRLSQHLAGRVAGEPLSCVRQLDLQGNRSVGGKLVFETRTRDLVYVNEADCPELTSSRALKTRTSTGQLCAGDIVDIIDPGTPVGYGSCGLGRFTPYRRQR